MRRDGLGIRQVSSLALTAFFGITCRHKEYRGTHFVSLYRTDVTPSEPVFITPSRQWTAIINIPYPSDHRQRSWDCPIAGLDFQSLFIGQKQAFRRARLLAIMAEHSSDWLYVYCQLLLVVCGETTRPSALLLVFGWAGPWTKPITPLPLWG